MTVKDPNRDEKGRFIPGGPDCFKKGYDPRRCACARVDKVKKGFYMDLLKWLEENIIEPKLVTENKDEEYIVNIWYTILNHDRNMFDPDTNNAKEYANNFMRVAASYIPEFQGNEDKYYVHRWDDHESRAKFCEWFCKCKAKLENYMAKEYFIRGKMKDNEILKRRFKKTWSESKVVEAKVDAEQNIKSDNKIEINIKDA